MNKCNTSYNIIRSHRVLGWISHCYKLLVKKKTKHRTINIPTDDGILMTFPFNKFLFRYQVNEVYKGGFKVVSGNSHRLLISI